MNRFLKYALFPLSLLLASCAVFAPRKDLSESVRAEAPAQFSLYDDRPLVSSNRWWESFGSEELNALMDEALASNPGVAQAWARLAQADALAQKAGAARWPWLGYEGDATRNKNSLTYQSQDFYSIGLNASYELDLWGRIKSTTQAAELDRAATREQVYTAQITLAAGVATRWAGAVAQELQTEVLRKQLAANQTSLELIELRFRRALSSALDVFQQRQVVAGAESRIPLAELRETLLLHELAALLGREDVNSVTLSSTTLPQVGPLPPLGIPADVLAARPDVRAAGLRLQAASWRVSAARADRLPAIRLGASGNYGSAEFSDVLDDWYTHLAASLTGPIFEGGRRKAEVKRARAVAEERLAFYRETVIRAIKEVEDALASEQKQRDYLALLDKQIQAARRSWEESENRYRNGMVDYTTVLIQLNSLQALERDRVEAQFKLLQYRIDLYRALGGTWPAARAEKEGGNS